jgi:HSP20 family protein
MHERQSGTFARQLAMGKGLATDKIEADYTDGVLRLVIPVAEEAQPRKIAVSHGNQRSEQAELVEGETDLGS